MGVDMGWRWGEGGDGGLDGVEVEVVMEEAMGVEMEMDMGWRWWLC